MPRQTRPKPLYQRGEYKLYPREGRYLEIVWYDAERKRERSVSAGTADIGEGRIALDRHYLKQSGSRMCPTCHRPWEHERSPTVLNVIGDYVIGMEGRAGYDSARHRLAHVIEYTALQNVNLTCAEIDPDWIANFRKWALARPVISPRGKFLRERSLSHVEGSVMQLAAAINKAPGQTAQFKAEQQVNVAVSPKLRVKVDKLAAMFRFCLYPDEQSEVLRELRRKERQTLLAYLRLAVASWARPETILAVQREQWHSDARVLDLNPPRRQRTNKRLPMVPIAKQMVPHLDAMDEVWIRAASVRSSWERMRKALGLPSDRQAGPKLIRRSMATIVRKAIGETHWRQGEIMLGHVPFAISDIYAIMEPENLGLVLAATESVIDEIEKLAPGAYYRTTTAVVSNLVLVK